MKYKDTILLGLFAKTNNFPTGIIRSIVENFDVNKVFIFNTESFELKSLLTFNVGKSEADCKLLQFKQKHNVLKFNRKKQNNILYTIDSLNKIIFEQNGKLDSSFIVNWEKYKNSCLFVDNNDELKIVKIKLNNIINLDY